MTNDRRTAGTGGVYQRGAVFWIRYSVRGRKVRESSGSTKRADAVRLLKRRLGEIGAGRYVGPDAEKVTLVDLRELILTDYRLKGRRSTLRVQEAFRHLSAFFTFARVPDITPDRVDAYITHRLEAKGREEGAAVATVQYELACLRRAFNLAWRAGKVGHVPYVRALAADNARKGFFELGDFEAIEAHLAEWLRPMMRFLYYTGWRSGEARGLTWAGVDFDAGIVRLEPGVTKNRDGREFPFAALPHLAELLREQRERTADVERRVGRIIPWVFHRPSKGRGEGNPILGYDDEWDRARRAAGLPGALVHDFRRTAVRNLERAGVSRSVAMKLTGHKTEAVYRRYAITSAADLSEGVAKLAALHGAPSDSRRVLPLRTGTVRAQSGA